MTTWQVQEAKQRFSEVLRQSVEGPQIITRHGKPTAVVLSYSDYEAERKERPSLASVILAAPHDVELLIPDRAVDTDRDLGLEL
ncbi:MAG: type II toxin-antitoxin system Phd/YefM family antitoxin [Corynebacterium sp.]|nr:type II toxin-antitoxin system Phd/YefM family antitoxin [Corynebacterium sp.]